MNLVPEAVFAIEFGEFLHFFSDFSKQLLVGGVVAPETDSQMLITNAKNHAVNCVAFFFREKPPNNIQ